MARKRLLREVRSMDVGDTMKFRMRCPSCGRLMWLRRSNDSEWTLSCWSHFSRTFPSPETAVRSLSDDAWWGVIRDEVGRRRGLMSPPDGLKF